MTSRHRRRIKSNDGGFLKVPKEVLRNPNFLKLSAYGNKLLLDLGEQYLGKNNGDLCATWSFMRERGWKSKDTLNNALKECLYYGFIVQTQYGGLNRVSLYALSWFKVDRSSKESDYRVGDRPTDWHKTKRIYQKINTAKRRAREKKQVRLAGQSSTAAGTVPRSIQEV